MTIKKVVLLIFIISVLISLLFYLKAPKIPKVKIITPVISKIESSILTTGIVEAQQETTICAKAKGVVDKVLVEEKARVEAGQELISFDREDALQRIEETQIKLKEAKNTLARAESLLVETTGLYGRQEVKEEELEITKTAYKEALLNKNSLQEELKSAKEHLNNLVYLAPQSGVVIEKNVLPKQYVLSNEVLLKIATLDKLQVCVRLSSTDTKNIKSGQQAHILAENSNKELSGYVRDIQPEEEMQDSTTYKIIIELAPAKKLPEIGERVEVKIIFNSKKNVLLLDSKAIFKEGHQNFVYLYKDGIVIKRVVRIGISNPGQTEIIFGILPADKIILPGNLKLEDKMKVKN
ncbi:MAG: efflux RND transporter periplasmic adaptor subunit [bacterium]|nr:efflux RND transporter periplasmic adaptor subunit [bacterium]